MSAEEKLDIVDNNSIKTLEWQTITPNAEGGWLNQRSEDFTTWPVIGEKKGTSTKFFETFSAGLQTNRDAWIYSYSRAQIGDNVERLKCTFIEALESIEPNETTQELFRRRPDLVDPLTIKWSSSLEQELSRRNPLNNGGFITKSLYRPFTVQHTYFDPSLNHRRYQLPSVFPTPEHKNIGYALVSPGEAASFVPLATNLLPDLYLLATSQCFSRFTWAPVGCLVR